MSKTRRSDDRYPEKEGRKAGPRPMDDTEIASWAEEDEEEEDFDDDDEEDEDDDWEPEWKDEDDDLRASAWGDDWNDGLVMDS